MKGFILVLFCMTTFSIANAVETDLSGNIEGQARQSWNNPQADQLGQDWEQAEFYMLYGNLNGKVEFDDSRLEANVFARYTKSELYKNPNYVAPLFFTFPNKLVARNIFKLEYKRDYSDHHDESIMNKLYYEWNYGEHRFVAGRMYINYGLGEIFNPINPFNQPTGLTSISQIAQGNDGARFTYYKSDKHSVEFYFLGDKYLQGHENRISKTLWVHGEYQATDKLQLDYVMGEDQKRYKVGGQTSYRFDEAMGFAQVLYQTEYLDNQPSSNLWDINLGFDQQMTNLWHVRIESGYQKKNMYLTPGSIGDRFLPAEYFIALANVYEVHPLVKLSGTFINDIKSGFTYLIAKSTFNLSSNTEAEVFGFSPLLRGGQVDNVSQKLVTTDIGVALRSFF